jgi:hypothetical protein
VLTTNSKKPILKTKKVALKDRKDKPDCLLREDQTPINFGDIDKMKVTDLKKYNKERGLPISGTKASLIDILKKYEQEDRDEEEDDDEEVEVEAPAPLQKKPITVLDPKKKPRVKKVDAKIIPLEDIVAIEDEYGNKIIDGNLVCDEVNGELLVIGCVDEAGDIVKLSRENVERCKELNVRFNTDEVE